jgi:hypothetical protein
MGAPVASGTLAGSTSGSGDSIHRQAASSDCSRFPSTPSGRTTRATLPDRRAAAVIGHDFRNREQQEREIGVTGLARFVRSTNAVVAGDCCASGSDSDVRLLAAADRGASKHLDDSRNRGVAGLRGGVLDGRDEPAIRRALLVAKGRAQAFAAGRPLAESKRGAGRACGAGPA